MIRNAKVAISLPKDMLEDIEKERQASGESRSEFFRRAAENLLKQQKEAEEIKAYINGYQQDPETSEDVETINGISFGILSKEPW